MAKPKTTKGASKRSGGGKNRIKLVQSDPPILVGGGGSSYLWIRLDQSANPVNPQSNNPATGINPGSPTPITRANYSCSRVLRTPPQIFFYDGVSPDEVPLDVPPAGRKTWYVRFE
jgi:hypothetical protein